MSGGGYIELERTKYGVAISWDRARKEVDLDLQVVLVDNTGLIVDAVFHNNITAMNGAVVHTGDTRSAPGDHFGELVWVDLNKIPMRIKLLIFVVAAASGGHLVDVRRGLISVIDGKKKAKAVYAMENSSGDVDAVVLMRRTYLGRWEVGPLDTLAEEGSSFLDIMDIIISLIKAEMPDAPNEQKVKFLVDKKFAGEKQSDVEKALQQRTKRYTTLNLSRYAAILSWEHSSSDRDVDLQALLVDEKGHIVDIVNSINISGMRGAVTRVSHEMDHEFKKPDIEVKVNLKALDSQARLVIFLLTTGHEQELFDLVDLSLLMLDLAEDKSSARMHLQTDSLKGRSKMLLVLKRNKPGDWRMMEMDEGTYPTTDIIGALGAMGKFIREFIPHAPPDEKLIRLQLTKGSAVAVPHLASFRRAGLSLTWAQHPTLREPVEMSFSLFLLDRLGKPTGIVRTTQMNAAAAQVAIQSPGHQEGDSNTQHFMVNIASVAKGVVQILLLVYVMHQPFEGIKSMSCSITDEAGAVLAQFPAPPVPPNRSGIVMARLVRLPDRSWMFQAVGSPCGGRPWSDDRCLADLRQVFDQGPLDLQPRLVDQEQEEGDMGSDISFAERGDADNLPPKGPPESPQPTLILSSHLMPQRDGRRNSKYGRENIGIKNGSMLRSGSFDPEKSGILKLPTGVDPERGSFVTKLSSLTSFDFS